ncbi:MAG: ABC transporter ATP-binding protein [Lachnospiraceae bacterium]|nr:ABC transporter ATP-binding protein [Lachnospiraceae bacterium]
MTVYLFTYGYRLLKEILLLIGYFMIFGKCGAKRYKAFIPFVKEYTLSLCADREKDGRAYTVFSGLQLIINVFAAFIPKESMFVRVLGVCDIILTVTLLVYGIRIYLGLAEVFKRSKKWVVLFILFEGVICLIWGFSSKFVPYKKIDSISKNSGAAVSGVSADTISSGLSVNITYRRVIDFFRKRYLLKDIHLNIPKGHLVLLLGGSGAGKTTFVNAVTGYEKANADIRLDERDIYKDYKNMKYDVGFVPQQDLMRENDTVLLTLQDAASLRLPSDISFRNRKGRISEVLDIFGLTAIKSSLVEKLSGGQKKRLSIAMEYISNPTLFILDEPDSGLDGVVARNLFEKLREIANTGKIVIVITHTPDRVIDLFDDVIVLAKDRSRTGRLAFYGPVKEAYDFFQKKSMEEILLSINQQDEGGEGRADEFVEKYAELLKRKVG